jgi:hypothetical protein
MSDTFVAEATFFADDGASAVAEPPAPSEPPPSEPPLDDLFASPVELAGEPVEQAQPVEQVAQVEGLQHALGERDERIARLTAQIADLSRKLTEAEAEAEAGQAARATAALPIVKQIVEIYSAGDVAIRVPRACYPSLPEIKRAVAAAARVYATAAHQPLLQISVADISTQQPTAPAALPPRRQRKKFLGIF